MQCFLALIGLFFSNIALAGPFDPAPQDVSVQILGILGNIGTVLNGQSNPVLQQIFNNFNWAMVSVSVVILGYVSVVSIINTAQEGEVMGKKWSSVWIPMRSMLGILFMVPIAGSGYSVIQAVVMWIAMQGVGLADSLWGIILNNLKLGISATTGVAINQTDQQALVNNGQALLQSMINACVCQQGINAINRGQASGVTATSPLALNQASLITLSNTSGTISSNATQASNTGSIYLGVSNVPNFRQVCGSWSINDVVTTADIPQGNQAQFGTAAQGVYAAQIYAMSSLYSNAKRIARAIINSNGNTAQVVSDLAGIQSAAIGAYVSIMMSQVAPPPSNADIDLLVKQGIAAGWSVGGSYYFALNKTPILSLLNASKTQPTTAVYYGDSSGASASAYLTTQENAYIAKLMVQANTFMTNEKGGGAENTLSGLQTAAATSNPIVKKLLAAIQIPVNAVWQQFANYVNGVGGPTNWSGQGSSAIAGAQATAQGGIYNLFSGGLNAVSGAGNSTDPLVMMAIFGQGVMFAAEVAWLAITAVTLVVSLSGLCAAVNPAFATFFAALFAIGTVAMGVLMALYSIGISLGLYVPMIPYIIFTTAVLGWAMLVIEAVVAGPIIALGIIAPSQDELGKIAAALPILGNIFLRPSLMIIGFILSAKLLGAIVKFVNFTFYNTVFLVLNPAAGLNSGNPGNMSMFMPIFVILLYTIFIITITNNIFSLIYILPDRILRYVGGGVEQVGQEVGRIAGEAKGGFDKGKGQVEQPMQTLGGAGMKELSSQLSEAKQKKNKD